MTVQGSRSIFLGWEFHYSHYKNMDKTINLYRTFMYKASTNFIRNEIQEQHYKAKCGDPNHYYEEAYKHRVNLQFLIEHGHAYQNDIEYGAILECVTPLTTNSFSIASSEVNTGQNQRAMLYFNVTGIIKLTLDENELRLLKIKDYDYYQTFFRFK